MTMRDTPVEPCCQPVFGPELAESEAHVLAERLKAVADPVRLQIINRLAPAVDGVCVCDLVEVLDRSQPTISHHLKILAGAGLVEREQRGRWAWYHLVESEMAQLRAALAPVEAPVAT